MVKKPTSTDVARLAGVSQSSVSLILNGNPKVSFSSETKERVFAAAKELGYHAKHQRRVVRRRGDLIMVLTPTLSNPYYCELSQAIESYAASRRYHAVVCNTFHNPEMEKYYLEALSRGRIGGIIYTFLPSFPSLVEQLSDVMPVILIGEKKDNLSICSIELSNRASGELLAEHLYHLGHREITFISTPINQTTLSREQRLEGMRDFFARQGLEGCVHMMEAACGSEKDTTDGSASYEYQVAKKLTSEFLASGNSSTALIGANDMLAIGICDTLRQSGHRVPEDYSVCGFDNIFMSSLLTPSLTTVDHRLELRSRFAVDMIVERTEDLSRRSAKSVKKAPVAVSKIEYAPNLIVRGSTGRRRQK